MIIDTLLPIEFVVVVVLHLFLLSNASLCFLPTFEKGVNDTFVYDEDHSNLVGLLCLTVEDGSFRDMVFLEASAS